VKRESVEHDATRGAAECLADVGETDHPPSVAVRAAPGKLVRVAARVKP
jgi:hypothetical protein